MNDKATTRAHWSNADNSRRNEFKVAAEEMFGRRVRWNDGAGGEGAGGEGGEGDQGAAGAGQGGQGAGGGQGQDQGQGGGTKSWSEIAGIEEPLRKHPALKDFKNPNDLAKSWVNAQKLIGKDKIPVPGEKATKEEWDQVYDKLGRPKKAEEYEVEKIPLEGVPEGFPMNEELRKGFASKAHELGLNKRQVGELYKWFMSENIKEYNGLVNNTKGAMAKGETALRQEWGQAFEERVDIAKKVIRSQGDPELIAYLEESGLGNDPRMIKFAFNVGRHFSEGDLLRGAAAVNMSPAEAEEEIAKIRADKKHAYWDKFNPEHKLAVARMEQLYIAAEKGQQ